MISMDLIDKLSVDYDDSGNCRNHIITNNGVQRLNKRTINWLSKSRNFDDLTGSVVRPTKQRLQMAQYPTSRINSRPFLKKSAVTVYSDSLGSYFNEADWDIISNPLSVFDDETEKVVDDSICKKQRMASDQNFDAASSSAAKNPDFKDDENLFELLLQFVQEQDERTNTMTSFSDESLPVLLKVMLHHDESLSDLSSDEDDCDDED